jgi:hypothetical protein
MTAWGDVQLSCQAGSQPRIWFSGGNLISQNQGTIANGVAYTLTGGADGKRAAPYDPGSAVSLTLDNAGHASYRVTATIGATQEPPTSLTVNLSY